MPNLKRTMDYGPKKLMEGDILWFLRVAVNDIFQYRIVMVALAALLMFHISSIFIQAYYFLVEPHLFSKYGPYFMGLFYPACAGVIVIIKKKTVETLFDIFPRWDILCASSEQEENIKKDVNSLIVFISVNNVMALTAIVLLAIPGRYDEDFFFFPFIVLRWIPELRKHSSVVILLYKFTVIPLTYSMIVHPYLLVYTSQHAKFQIRLCLFYIHNADAEFRDTPDDILALSVLYQCTLYERMKFCIKRHQELWTWGTSRRRDMTGPVFAFLAICGFLLGLSIIFTLVQLEQYGNSKLLISWEVMFSIAALVTFASLIYSGQLIEDELYKIERELIHLKWYTWNNENRKLFLKILTAFLVPFKLSFSGKYALNYDLAVGMLKGLYSITSVYISMVKR